MTSYQLADDVSVEAMAIYDFLSFTSINLTGNNLAQSITGNNGANVLSGGGGNDALDGGGGNDTLIGGTGTDTMTGGAGNDAFVVEQAGDAVTEAVSGGYDTAYVLTSYELGVGQEVEVLTVYDRDTTSAMTLTGNNLANTIYGNQGTNVLNGGGGNDVMYGLGGNDSYIVEQAGDVIVEGTGGGFDTVYALTSYQLATGEEVETLTVYDRSTTNALNLIGNNLVNTIYGNAGANNIDSKGGADTLYGMGGADTFTFTNAPVAGQADTIADFSGDVLALDDQAFLGVGAPGALNPSAFVVGAAAADASDRIVYNQATGQLFFDADGTGAGAQVLFATITAGTVLTASDFLVI